MATILRRLELKVPSYALLSKSNATPQDSRGGRKSSTKARFLGLRSENVGSNPDGRVVAHRQYSSRVCYSRSRCRFSCIVSKCCHLQVASRVGSPNRAGQVGGGQLDHVTARALDNSIPSQDKTVCPLPMAFVLSSSLLGCLRQRAVVRRHACATSSPNLYLHCDWPTKLNCKVTLLVTFDRFYPALGT